MKHISVIGGGPAGLRAAEVAAEAGAKVTLFDGKRSVGRKLLVAGKGGFNITHGEDLTPFVSRYSGPNLTTERIHSLIADFDNKALRAWAALLDVGTFKASSGRIYPKALKAAPLLRRWVAKLKQLGVTFEMNHQWTDITPGPPHQIKFTNGETVTADAVIFALGGGSWSNTGSDGSWVTKFESLGIQCNPLYAANCGWEHPWSDRILSAVEGQPLKNITVSAGDTTIAGELLITQYGLEGGTIYQLGRELRAMDEPAITIDFKPTFTIDRLIQKMESAKRNYLNEASKRWKLSAAALAMLGEHSWNDTESLANAVKAWRVPLAQPRPLEEAISSAGGVCWDELDDQLMLKRFPGIYVAGEMINWEAPTGGYLMQASFATGTRAGTAAATSAYDSP